MLLMQLLRSAVRRPLAATLLLAFTVVSAGICQAEEWEQILPDGAKVEKLADGFTFTEGPAWHPNGFLVFTDIPNDRIVKYDGENTSDFVKPVGRCNGLMCDQQGYIYACQMGEGHVLKMDENGEVLGQLVNTFEGKRMNGPNDLAIDSKGGMYFTDPYYGPDKPLPQPMMAVYYITHNGKVTRIIDDLERPNGVTISPNGKFLYVAEPNKGEVYRYEITAPGKITSKKLIFTGDKSIDGQGGPDGMTHDVHGNLYTTYNGIVVLSPEGELIGRIPVPEKPSNCTFGGKDNKTLFITARTGLYKIELGLAGLPLPKKGPELPKTAAKSSKGLVVMTVADTKPAAKTRDVNLGGLTLSVPESWQQQEPSNRLRLGQFTIPAADGAEGETELVVFPPFGGSIDDNIGRWVRQFDAEGAEVKLTRGKTEQGEYHMADISGTYKKPDGPPFLQKTIDAPDHRMLAVIIAIEGQGNYFLKLVGPKETVSKAVDEFRASFGAKADAEEEYKLAQ